MAIVASATVGLLLGLGLARRMSPDKLRRAFAVLVAVMAVVMLVREAGDLLGG